VAHDPRGRVILVRHAQTEWSETGRHTGRTDIPLTDAGRATARALGSRLEPSTGAVVMTSPLDRARDTCRLAGLGEVAQERAELLEWDYGAYEGLTTPEIRRQRPGWDLWRDGCPDGESAAEVAERLSGLLGELHGHLQDTIVFAHGHVLRVLAARWIGLAGADGARLGLQTGAVGVLGHERERPVLWRWNQGLSTD